MPDAAWPNLPTLPNYQFTAADHAAHTSPKGVVTWEQHVPGTKSHKMAKLAMKFAHKPHLKFSVKSKSPRRGPARKRKKEK